MAKQAGQYWAVVRNDVQGCTAYSDTLRLEDTPLPVITVTPQRVTTAICPNDSLLLTASYQVSYTYQWLLDGKPLSGITTNTITARRAGQYSVLVTDTTTCQALSSPFDLSIVSGITITLDSIAPLCGTDHPPITLYGYPVGGVFSGPGVNGNQYDPRLAGTGTHLITYTIDDGRYSCQNGKAERLSLVQTVPVIRFGPNPSIWRGGTVQLHSGLSGAYHYQWTPLTNLANSTSPDPETTPEKTTSYTLTVTDSYGCSTMDSITVYVYERIWIPDAFTPNGDSMNDEWELRGIGSYPLAEVTVFDRWGEVVFFSIQYKKPFDGNMNGLPLPPGVYTYQIKPAPSHPAMQGSLLLLK